MSARFFSNSATTATRKGIHLVLVIGKPDAKSQLLKSLDSEIAIQKELVESNENTQPLPDILQEYSEILTNGNWKVSRFPN